MVTTRSGSPSESRSPIAIPAGTGPGGEYVVNLGGILASSRTDPSAGIQVPPPSTLSSRKTSKKLLVIYLPLPSLALTLKHQPLEASVGLSRTLTPAGKLPPEILNDNISVSNVCSSPTGDLGLMLTTSSSSLFLNMPAWPVGLLPRRSAIPFQTKVCGVPGAGARDDPEKSSDSSVKTSKKLLAGNVTG